MGSAKNGRLLIGIVLLVGLVTGIPFGCKSKNNSVSSQSFLAPQPIDVDPITGVNNEGQRAVDIAITKLDILHEVYRDKETGEISKLDSELKTTSARLTPVGKIDDARLLIYEEISKTMLTLDLYHNTVVKEFDREEVLALFKGQAQKPAIGAVIKLQNGWLLGYETTSKSLFGIRQNPDGDGIIGSFVMDQSEMQSQVFPVECFASKTQVTIASMLEFEPNKILVVPINPNITALLLLEITDNGTSLDGQFVLNECEQFLDFKTKIKPKTGNIDVDLNEFPPVKVPGEKKIVIFDRAKDTSSFLVIEYHDIGGGVLSTTVDVATTRNELVGAIQNVNQGGEAFTGQFLFSTAFSHPNASLSPTDPKYTPYVLAFDDPTNNLVAFDFSQPADSTEKIKIFTSATQLSTRTDLRYDPVLDSGTFDPALLFSSFNVVDNKLAWDGGPGQLVSFSNATGQVVVVLHKRDITAVTGAGLVDINYIETLDPPPSGKGTSLRLIDLESASVVAVRVSYAPVPVKYPRSI